jgi:hypothetical protein
VEYSLVNPLGYAVLELLKAIAEWGGKHRQSIEDREVSLPNVTALSSNHCPNSDRHPREITHISRSTT